MEHRRSLVRPHAVTELRRALPFLLLPLLMLAMGCNLLPPDLLGNPTPPPARDEATPEPVAPDVPQAQNLATIDAWLATWQEAGVDDYRWQLEFGCFCMPSPPLVLTVENGQLVDWKVVGGEPPEREPDGGIQVVEDIYAVMRETIVRGGTVEDRGSHFAAPAP